MASVLSALALLLILLSTAARAQQASLPGCEPPPALRKAIKDQLESKGFRHLDYQEREESRQRILADLFAKYPRELAAYRLWIVEAQIDSQYGSDRASILKIQKQLRERAAAYPDDALALDLYASAVRGVDTPASIRMLGKAQSLAPTFAWPSLDLAQIYSSGKFADKPKFIKNLTEFWTACPTSRDRQARWMLVKVPELQALVAKAEGAALEKEADPERLKDYEFLWGLEFRVTSPQKFPELRRQIAADVKRLEHLDPDPDAAWANMLIQGSRQAQAGPELITAAEDALIAKYPHSDEAYGIISGRWKKAHPEPAEAKDVAAWKAYRADWARANNQWMQQYPDHFFPEAENRFFYLLDDDAMGEQQYIAMAEACLKAAVQYEGPSAGDSIAGSVAYALLNHHWAPDRALALLQRYADLDALNEENYTKRDDQSDEDRKQHAASVANSKRDYTGLILLAALRAHRQDAVASIKASVEAPRGADDKDESGYWLRRARLAAIEGQPQDALGYYQLALRTRSKAPGYERGLLRDELGEEAHALWTQRGGTEVAWTAFSQAGTSSDAAKADDARWEKPTKQLPTLELTDLSGKTWSVKSLNGKVVLINLWATWCGPCNAELPQLQKLFEQARGRSDVQILTFNIDEDLGLVEPFMKEKGYTFPVVPAYSYVVNLLDGYAIPQNWLLDAKGQWEWTQVGYGSDDAWVKDMLAKVDAVKAGS